MEFVRREAPYLAPKANVQSMMLQVLLALVPAALAHIWYFGPGFVFNLIIATAFCVGGEALMMRARGRDPLVALSDFSAVVTAALLALALPSLTPWWVTATGALFGIVVAKHLYGGVGFNIFNPAMAGYVVILVAFPSSPPPCRRTGQTRSASSPGLFGLLSSDAASVKGFQAAPSGGRDWQSGGRMPGRPSTPSSGRS